jgi:hypothetical protein
VAPERQGQLGENHQGRVCPSGNHRSVGTHWSGHSLTRGAEAAAGGDIPSSVAVPGGRRWSHRVPQHGEEKVVAEHWQNRGAVAGGGCSPRSHGRWRRLSGF